MSSKIDTLLKVTTTPTKQATTRAAEDKFNNYLRQAASTQSAHEKSVKDQAPKNHKPVGNAAANRDKQENTSSPDDEAHNTLIDSDAADVETDATIVDEVLLSVAASVTVTSPTEIITAVEFIAEELTAEPITVMSHTEQSEPLPTGDSVTAPRWGDELTAATTTEPILADATTAISLEFSTVTMADVVEETATADLGTGESQSTSPAVATVKSVIAQAASADSILPPAMDSDDEAAEQLEVLEIETPVPELAAGTSSETATESDGKISEHNAKAPASPTSVTPATTGSQQMVQPNGGWQGSSAAPVAKQDSDSTLSTIDRARFVQRVANAFRSAQNNEGHIQLRLSPPELGSLRIEIAVRNGVLSANLEAETADARRVLLDNLPALRQRLAEQDIRIEKFEVDIRREGGQPDGQADAREQQTEQQSQRGAIQNRIRPHSTTSDIHTSRITLSSITNSDAALDVRI